MSSVKPKGGYADKIFGSGLPGVYWPYIEGWQKIMQEDF